MEGYLITRIAICMLLVFSVVGPSPSRACHFPAIYNFGDSNSDTGSVSAVFGSVPHPNGQTFFGKPSGRISDGRLIIDFLAEKLGLSYLSAFLDAIEPKFRHGANFASSGATIQPANEKIFGAGLSPLSLDIQLAQFEHLKHRTIELHKQAENSRILSSLPRVEDFSDALYTLDIGHNDIYFAFMSMTKEQALASIPCLIDQFALAIEKLYQEGARTFWIHNTGPIGCLPLALIYHPPKSDDTDQIGCVKSYNELAQEFNKQLKERVYKLRASLSDAQLIVVDIYSAKYTLIRDAEKYGFVDPVGYCCGHSGDNYVECGQPTRSENGTEVYGASCSDPSKHISWDAIHYTEAANQLVANRIVDGSLSDPPIPLTEACSKFLNTGL